MNFVYPTFLYALGFALVPFIIHLFNLRKYKKIYFSNTSLLLDIQTQSNKTSKPIELIVLLCRCLLIIFLVMAFAQPYISKGASDLVKANKILIVIDNSMSMQRLSEHGRMLQVAKKDAINVIERLDKNKYYKIITTDLQPIAQYWLSYKEAIQAVERINYNYLSYNFNQIDTYLKSINKSTNSQLEVYIFSDFQSQYEIQHDTKDSKFRYTLFPYSGLVNNVSIDTCYIEELNVQKYEKQSVWIELTNHTDEVKKVPLKLDVNGNIVSQNMIEIAPFSKHKEKFEVLNKGEQAYAIKAFLDKEDALAFDNEYYSYVRTNNRSSVVVISETKTSQNFFRRMFQTDSTLIGARFYEPNNIDYEVVNKANLIILNQVKEIPKSLFNVFEQGKQDLVILPHKKLDYTSYSKMTKALQVNTYNELDTTNILAIVNVEQSFFSNMIYKKTKSKEMELFWVDKHYKIDNTFVKNKNTLLKCSDNSSLLSKYTQKNRSIYLFSIGLNTFFSDFYKHQICLPIFFQIILENQNVQQQNHNIASDIIFDINATNQRAVLIGKDSTEYLSYLNNQTLRFKLSSLITPGFYNVVGKGDPSFLIITALNASRRESVQKEIKKNASVFSESKTIESINDVVYSTNSQLWKYSLYAALFFLFLEIILLKYLSHYAKRNTP